eukprot:IDg14633t1
MKLLSVTSRLHFRVALTKMKPQDEQTTRHKSLSRVNNASHIAPSRGDPSRTVPSKLSICVPSPSSHRSSNPTLTHSDTAPSPYTQSNLRSPKRIEPTTDIASSRPVTSHRASNSHRASKSRHNISLPDSSTRHLNDLIPPTSFNTSYYVTIAEGARPGEYTDVEPHSIALDSSATLRYHASKAKTNK